MCISLPANCSLDESEFEEALKLMRNHVKFDEKPSIRILVTGKTGVGKSTLVNALIGMEVAETGDKLMGVTDEVEEHTAIKNGIHIHIYDTPGLGTIGMKNNDNLHNTYEKCKDVDLFLFCLRMTDQRFDSYEIKEMELIASVFGHDIWKKGVIVLTHANHMPNETKQFKDKLQEWQDLIRNTKITSKIFDSQVAENIPIVPTGFKEPQLPDRPSWVSEFWIQGFRRMGFKPMLYLIQVNKDRMHSTRDGVSHGQNPEDQPLIACNMSRQTFERPIDPERFQLLSGLIGAAIGSIAGMGFASVPIAGFTSVSCMGIANLLYQRFGWTVTEIEINCYVETLGHSLIAAFLEEYPEYLQSPEFQNLFKKS